MKKLLSTKYSDPAFNLALLFLRLAGGLLMIPHGYDKLVHFFQYKSGFMNFLGLGGTVSLALVVFSEFFCPILLILGLFSRIVAFILSFEMCVVIFKAHRGDIFGNGEHASLYLACFLAILLLGPGRISADAALGN